MDLIRKLKPINLKIITVHTFFVKAELDHSIKKSNSQDFRSA